MSKPTRVQPERMLQDISRVLDPLITERKENNRIRKSEVEALLQPVIGTYAPLAAQGQKVGKEVRQLANTYLAGQGFIRRPDREGSPDYHRSY